MSLDGPKTALGLLAAATIALAFSGANVSPWWVLGGYAALFPPWFYLLGRRDKLELPHILAAAVVVRLALAFAEPLLSDDLFRYVWDGRVWASGTNPFVHAPSADALAHLRDSAIWPHINHPDIPTIYPPLAQMLFGVNGLLGGGTALLKLLLLAAEGAGLGAAWWWFGRRQERWTLVRDIFVIYALNPLVMVEVAWSGHVDVLAWTPMAVALVVWTRGHGWKAAVGAAVLLGLSVAAKFLSLAALPLMVAIADRDTPLFGARSLTRRAILIAVVPLVVFATYLPFMSAGEQLFSGFNTYASAWRGNDGPFRAAYTVALDDLRSVDVATHPHAEREDDKVIYRYEQHDEFFEDMGWTKTWQGREIPATSFAADQIAQQIAKFWAAIIVGLALLWSIIVVRDPIRGTLVVLGTLFFVAPVVHPWYVAWLVPLAALLRVHAGDSRLDIGHVGSPTALIFSNAVLFAYLGWAQARTGGSWQVPDWAVAVEFGIIAVVAVWELTRTPRG
ncbi:MAG: hypothetical protein ACQEVA_03725 [Myxococcota bacterium]